MSDLAANGNPAEVMKRIVAAFAAGGAHLYFGEAVTQLEHALQTAAMAERRGAAEPLIVAALLHDVGHLLHGLDEHIAERGVDARHEDVADRWLSNHFGPAVTEPVRLHVAAKRYLCAVDPEYLGQLSEASRTSLTLQQGPMSPAEVRLYEQLPWSGDATALRRWDDAAKVPGLSVPGLDHYRPRIERQVKTW